MQDLVNPEDPDPQEGATQTLEAGHGQPETEFLKSLEAEYTDVEPLGQIITEGLANIAKKRWGISLTSEKLKSILAKHAQPQNSDLHVPKVNLEIWEPLTNYQRKADLWLKNIQQA